MGNVVLSFLKCSDLPGTEESVLEVCASPRSFTEEEPTDVATSDRSSVILPSTQEATVTEETCLKQKTETTRKLDRSGAGSGEEISGGVRRPSSGKENLKRTADNVGHSSPIRWSSPKRAKVHTSPRSESSTQGFKIPAGSRREEDGDRARFPYNNVRRDRSRIDDGRRRSSGHHSSDHGDSRRENHHGITSEQRRWLSQMPRHWRWVTVWIFVLRTFVFFSLLELFYCQL